MAIGISRAVLRVLLGRGGASKVGGGPGQEVGALNRDHHSTRLVRLAGHNGGDRGGREWPRVLANDKLIVRACACASRRAIARSNLYIPCARRGVPICDARPCLRLQTISTGDRLEDV